jgi:hypothetical protein
MRNWSKTVDIGVGARRWGIPACYCCCCGFICWTSAFGVRDVVPDMIIGHMSRARVGLLIM